ncbi:MAG: biopolymer transporter ExbD [Magnetococcus sp. DMHC-1]|nr:biopolymer transporter ExbD [Magnetococcales bacterium]
MATGFLDHDGEDRPLAEINVTPLVDVMLVLLVIFIILAPVMAQSLRIDLPKTTANAPLLPDPLIVTLHQDGTMQLGDLTLTPEHLANRLQTASAQTPDTVLRIDADKNVIYQKLADLLALAQSNGIRKISFTTSAAP